MVKILLALDGSTSSAHVFDAAMNLVAGWAEKPTIHLVHVREPLTAKGSFESLAIALEALEKQSQEQADAMLRPFGDRLRGSGATFTQDVLVGDPATTIATYGREHGCDMIIMGTRGHSALAGWLLGSVAAKVLTLSRVPVMLVPNPRAEQEKSYPGFAFPN